MKKYFKMGWVFFIVVFGVAFSAKAQIPTADVPTFSAQLKKSTQDLEDLRAQVSQYETHVKQLVAIGDRIDSGDWDKAITDSLSLGGDLGIDTDSLKQSYKDGKKIASGEALKDAVNDKVSEATDKVNDKISEATDKVNASLNEQAKKVEDSLTGGDSESKKEREERVETIEKEEVETVSKTYAETKELQQKNSKTTEEVADLSDEIPNSVDLMTDIQTNSKIMLHQAKIQSENNYIQLKILDLMLIQSMKGIVSG
ncbi:MAG: hypothetical protein PHI50_01410 [Alphaproteobacteria bacterium]|nr:hypothetical protein [Alphaproteobacteria bacterium]